MRVSYDPDVDALYVELRSETVVDSIDVAPGVSIDLAEDGQIVGLEVLNAHKRLGDSLRSVAVDLPIQLRETA